MVYDTYNYRIHGVYKPTFTSLGGRAQCIGKIQMIPPAQQPSSLHWARPPSDVNVGL